jgi:hypothetical protein
MFQIETLHFEFGVGMITTGWKQPVYILTDGLNEGVEWGWHFEYKSGAMCYVNCMLALPATCSS